MQGFARIPKGYKSKTVYASEAQYYIYEGWRILEVRNGLFETLVTLIKKKKSKSKSD